MRTRRWHTPGWRTRLVAGAVSLGLAVALLFVLSGSRLRSAPRPPSASVVVLLLPAPATAPPSPPPEAMSPRPADARALRHRAARPESISPLRIAPTEAPLAQAGPVSAASAPASAPLRIDAQAIRRAIAGSRGAVRTLAGSTGAELDSGRPTPTARLGSAIAEGAVPDCLGPNDYGSLLSAPIIAVQALRGKCK